MKDNKIVIIVNGQGGVGKDTLCDYFSRYYNANTVSAITPIKEYAKLIGIDINKSDKNRKFLSDFKFLLDEYDKTTTRYLTDELEKFIDSSFRVLFCMIREPDQIDEFKEIVRNHGMRVATLLVRREAAERTFGNDADDNVENYHYDYIFENNMALEFAHSTFVIMVKGIIDEAV